ncbi:PilZ domain-containing protein [Novosphingobium sp. CF614]|uniref:PilZ domain-containing protein n=1 Tax=Novosphingobium sp. CF614 TaxID=1884364 RepID=UPI0008E574EE|nr:PilZ domain-containing protein [Novosphingobium sp. CF614]SFG50221.1 PilZ domain-containing protein [Novosphingobium sp. CF614]
MRATAGLQIAEVGCSDAARANLAPAREDGEVRHRPRAPRQRTLIRAVMHGPGIPGHEVIVRDVSARGMRIAGRGLAPRQGETLGVTLSSGIAQDAQVRWVEGDEFGIELFEDLDLQRLGLTNQRRHGAGAIHWLVDERLRRPEQPPARLRRC